MPATTASRRFRLLAPVVAVAALLVAAFVRAPVRAATTSSTFVATADAYVDAAKPKTNFGRATELATSGSPEVRSYLKFSLTGLSGTVTSATVRVFATSAGSGVEVRQAGTTSWSETKIKYRGAPSVGGVIGSAGAYGANGWVSLNVTSLVTGNGTLSVALTSSGARQTYASRETGANAPQLVVETETTPSPSPSPPSGDPKVAAAGDIACDPNSGSYNNGLGTVTDCRQRYTSDLIYGAGYAGVLLLGDNQYENGAKTKYDVSYNPTWGREKAITYPAPGNHEYVTSGASGYFQYFGTAAGDPLKGYYSFDIGSWHFIALNSNCGDIDGGCAANGAQEQWLRSDLQAHPTSCTLAYWHHPRFSSGPHGSSTTYTAFWQALYDHNADVVLVGHDHDYERFGPQNPNGGADATRGIRQFVVGTGGKSHYATGTPVANSQIRNSDTYGILELTLHTDGYDWRFIPEAGKTFTDSGSGTCH